MSLISRVLSYQHYLQVAIIRENTYVRVGLGDFFIIIFYHHHFRTLSGLLNLLDKPWSQVLPLLPPGTCFHFFVAHWVQHCDCSSMSSPRFQTINNCL